MQIRALKKHSTGQLVCCGYFCSTFLGNHFYIKYILSYVECQKLLCYLGERSYRVTHKGNRMWNKEKTYTEHCFWSAKDFNFILRFLRGNDNRVWQNSIEPSPFFDLLRWINALVYCLRLTCYFWAHGTLFWEAKYWAWKESMPRHYLEIVM